jgi:CpeT/CpcT family (DUF1001)
LFFIFNFEIKMSFSPQILALAEYLSGEFENKDQALAEPVWYVNVKLWQRPVALFTEDSLTFFAEQANILSLQKPYRQRIMRLTEGTSEEAPIKVQYYMLKNPTVFSGGGVNPVILKNLAMEELELLPGCILDVKVEESGFNTYKFIATSVANSCCSFTYEGNTVYVSLGFTAKKDEFFSFDKGIDPTTGSGSWGAVMGPYRYIKCASREC